MALSKPSPLKPEQKTYIVLKFGWLQSNCYVTRLLRKVYRVVPQQVLKEKAYSISRMVKGSMRLVFTLKTSWASKRPLMRTLMP